MYYVFETPKDSRTIMLRREVCLSIRLFVRSSFRPSAARAARHRRRLLLLLLFLLLLLLLLLL